MNVEDRLLSLEVKLRRTRLLLLVLFICLLLIGTVAATGPFANLVCGSLTVMNPEGKPVIELKDDGQVHITGRLNSPQVPLGMMLPYFGDKIPHGFVLADGETKWPSEEWVPTALHGKPVPDMRNKLIGGAASTAEVGWVWDDEKSFLPQDPESIGKANTMGRAPRNPIYAKQDLLGGINPVNEKRVDSIAFPGGVTFAAIPVHRHVLCKWIIRVK